MRKAYSEISKRSVCLFIAILYACSSKPTPEPIHVGEDVCANCRMAIIELQFASEIILSSGEVLKFDDLGCLASRLKNLENLMTQNIFVNDYMTKEWINSEKAVIVRGSTMQTPMGSGSVAFNSRNDAEKFAAASEGQLITLQEFLQK